VKVVCFFGLKGGVGKTTLAAATTAAALEAGLAVAVLDLDGSGAGLSAFVERRREAGLSAPQTVTPPTRSFLNAPNSRRATEEMEMAVEQARRFGADCLLIDTSAGRDALWMNAAAILACQVLVTPVTDSPIDMAVLLAKTGSQNVADFVQAAAGYRGRGAFRWLVARNRCGHLRTRLGDRITDELVEAAGRVGFEIIEGLRERVTYREMFEDGRSPLDAPRSNQALGMSTITARAEARGMLAALDLQRTSGTPAWFRQPVLRELTIAPVIEQAG
jgi:chromosome partitioning protein